MPAVKIANHAANLMLDVLPGKYLKNVLPFQPFVAFLKPVEGIKFAISQFKHLFCSLYSINKILAHGILKSSLSLHLIKI